MLHNIPRNVSFIIFVSKVYANMKAKLHEIKAGLLIVMLLQLLLLLLLRKNGKNGKKMKNDD